ncbi:MAG: hypothetical protein EB051_01565 [Chlamydiia bacterium]|nr:hypothetical protein [Chlamydiia bacterium]
MKKKWKIINWKDMLLKKPILYTIMFLGLLPSIAIAYHFYGKNMRLSDLSTQLESLHQRSQLVQRKKNTEEQILSQMQGADPYYLDKYVESLSFLEAEQKKWERLSLLEESTAAVAKRMDFLRSNKNKLAFAEGMIVQEGRFKEVEEKQKHPIEINEDDLKKILSVLEGVDISPYLCPEKHPQCIIKQFELTKKMHQDIKEKVFILSMQLLKRELAPPTNP